MGDMKTPDFDDLLAAFDIPDIDAKEAIQSSSGDPDGNHIGSGAGGKERSEGPSQRPASSSDVTESIPPASHDLSAVSVIVKNSVCSDAYISGEEEEDEDMVKQVSSVLDEMDRSGGGAMLTPQLLPRAHSLMPSDALIHNGFKAVSDGAVEASLHSTPTQMQTNGQLWSLCSPKSASEIDEDNQDGSSCSHSAIFPSHVPLPVPTLSTNVISLLPSKVDEDEAEHPSSPIHSRLLDQSLNCTSDSAVHHPLCEDEESEPDLESPPLMIQESPDLQMSPNRHGSPSDFPATSPSTRSLAISKTPVSEDNSVPHLSTPSGPHQALAQSSDTPACMTEKNNSPNAERCSEHIIDERDSPESPEPETPACLQDRDLTDSTHKCTSPIQPATSRLTAQQEEKEPGQGSMTEIPCKNDAGLSGHLMKSDDEQTKEGVKVDSEGAKFSGIDLEPAAKKSTDSSVVPSRPLKVRIKTIKSLTGNITRTVTRVAPKGAAGGATKGPDGVKIQLGARKVLSRPKRPAAAAAAVSGQPQGSKTPVLPVATLQDASAAMLFAASKVQKVTLPPARSGPKAAAILPTSSQSKAAVTARVLGQKTVCGAGSSVRPASVKNGPGAAVSRSQSSLVEAFNKILNGKNPLPSYQPDLSTLPPPEWNLGVPSNGYRCLECGDAFALERSLARHYDRRSLRIEVTCSHCAMRLVFFNKCSLLLHAREHKEKGLVMQCSHLVMRPVSVEQMIGQPDTVPVGVLSPPLLASTSVSGTEELSVQPGVLDNRCPECNSPFSSKEELAAHFQHTEPSCIDTCCLQCSPPMPMWNPCSTAAHRRLHQQLSPLVCPECGLVSQTHGLSAHLQQACLHYARQLGHRCACCQLVFGGANSLNAVKTHMQTAHCEIFHKCPSCPMAFKSASSADAHCTAQHPDLTHTAKQSKEIYKCVMCRTVFTQKPLLNVHFDTHLVKQKVHVFKCPDCNKVFTQRSSLLEHVKASHSKSTVHVNDVSVQRGSVKMETSDGEEWKREEEVEQGKRRNPVAVKNPTVPDVLIWSCAECRTRYTDKDSYISHMANQHGKELKRFPCTACEGSFSSSSSLRRHIRVKHKGIKRATFYCQLCTEGKKSFSSKLVLEKHMQIHHSGQRGASTQSQVCPRSTDTADSSSEQDGGPSTVTAASEEDSSLAEGLTPRTGRGGWTQEQEGPGFRCMPCGFVSEDKEEFRVHIKSHRGDEGRTVQCQQCGACFASGSSLSRHRFISHRMRDAATERPPTPTPDGDDRQSNMIPGPTAMAASPGTPSQVEDGDGEGKLVCKVCRCQFSKAADLNTHFRTHGMAFLTSYKADKLN
ncbi:zinc finger protein 687a isoform X2 [Brachyhypopomus gauderio]